MKTIILILGFVTTFNPSKLSSDSLDYITPTNKLELFFVDDKCGEFGGDEKIITIYREIFNGPLMANYIQKRMDCKTLKEPVITRAKKRLKVSKDLEALITNCVKELAERKHDSIEMPSHSGLFCKVKTTNSSIMITDFPAKRWGNFEVLSSRLAKL